MSADRDPPEKQSQPSSSIELVPATTPGFALTHNAGYWTSLPLTTAANRMELAAALSGKCDTPDKWVNRTLHVVNVTRYPISFTSEADGELVNTVANVLHLEGGERVIFKSDMIGKSLNILAIVAGCLPPWSPGIKCILERTPCRNGHSFYSLFPCEADEMKVAPAKKK